MKMKLTPKQAYYLRHINKHGETSETAVAKSLEQMGLLHITHNWERREWNRTVATLRCCVMTPVGQELAAADSTIETARIYVVNCCG